MAYTPEPNISKGTDPERCFQEAIKQEINELLRDKSSRNRAGSLARFFVLEGFGLDLAVFLEWWDARRVVKLLELKAFVGSRQGGVGFGDRKGGRQVDLLSLSSSDLALADHFSRWILVDGTLPYGEKRFALFCNSEARDAAMGGVRRGKQNNLRISSVMQHADNWDSLSNKLGAFLDP